jgi:hypothetical protein
MMTREHRQEALCRAYVLAIAAQAGVSWSKPDPDYGTDLSLRLVSPVDGRLRDAGAQIDLQLRSTTRAIVSETEVMYDLDVDTYNNLRNVDRPNLLFLVLLAMPPDEALWLSQDLEQLCLRHCAYWISLRGFPPTPATRSIRITIPRRNIFSVEALMDLLQQARERKRP